MLWGWCVVGVGESRGWVSRGGGHIKVVPCRDCPSQGAMLWGWASQGGRQQVEGVGKLRGLASWGWCHVEGVPCQGGAMSRSRGVC